MLHVEQAMFNIDGKNILNPVQFQFAQDKIYGIIGPNGSGKSTFLKVISGFLTPNSGKVYFQGNALTKPNEKISVVWQNPYMFQTNVFENVAYGLKVRNFSKAVIKSKVLEILNQFQLDHLAAQKATTLSGGEIAKVAIARAIITSPEILILDEPTASLDPQNVLEIEQIILQLKKQFKVIIIFVTHNMFQAKRIADETLFFYKGNLIEAQPTNSLFAKPNNALTKKFLSGDNYF